MSGRKWFRALGCSLAARHGNVGLLSLVKIARIPNVQWVREAFIDGVRDGTPVKEMP